MVTGFSATAFEAPKQLELRVGADGPAASDITGLIPIVGIQDETEYQLTILIKDDQRPHGQKQARDVYSHVTGINASEYEVAFSLLKLFATKGQNGSKKDYSGRFVGMDIISKGAFSATADNDGVFVQNSKVVTFASGALSGGVAIATGDVLQVEVTDSNGATKAISLKVESSDGTNVTLETPFMYAGGTVTSTDIDVKVAADASAASELYAFSITALKPSAYWNGIDTYETVLFDASFFESKNSGNDGESAPSFVSQAYIPGAGTGYQVHDMVYFAQGYRGVNSRMRWFDNNINPVNDADISASYGIVNINFEAEYRTDFQNKAKAPKSAQIAIVDGSANATGFVAILNAYFGALGFGAVSL